MVLSTPRTSRVAALAATLLFSNAHAAPFDTTDQNPLLTGAGLPHPFSSRLLPSGASSVAATLNWSSTASIQRSANESLTLDAESREWRISIEHSLSDQFAIRVEIPYRTLNGGSLDDFVDEWHSLFGFPTGARPALPKNAYRIQYARAGQTLAAYSHDGSGIGDIAFAIGHQLQATPRTATDIWLSIKLPTGDSDALLGNGAYGAALSLAHEYVLSRRWSVFAQANGVYSGPGDILPDQRQFLWSGSLGFDYAFSDALSLAVQLDAHSPAFENSSLDLLGDAWILTFGGEYRFAKQWRVQLGVSEDVKVEASPDVTFVLRVAKSWK